MYVGEDLCLYGCRCVCVWGGGGVAVDVGHLELVITMNYKRKDSA